MPGGRLDESRGHGEASEWSPYGPDSSTDPSRPPGDGPAAASRQGRVAAGAVIAAGILGLIAWQLATPRSDAPPVLFLVPDVAGVRLVDARHTTDARLGGPLSSDRIVLLHRASPQQVVVVESTRGRDPSYRSGAAFAVTADGVTVWVDRRVNRTIVSWISDEFSGQVSSPSVAEDDLVRLAATTAAAEHVVAPSGFDTVPVEDADSAYLSVTFANESVTPATGGLRAFHRHWDAATAVLVDRLLGAPATAVTVDGRPGVVSRDSLVWSPSDGTTLWLSFPGFRDQDLAVLAKALQPVTADQWTARLASARLAGARLEAGARHLRTIARGAARDGRTWAVSQIVVNGAPSCLLLEVAGHGPATETECSIHRVIQTGGVVAASVAAGAEQVTFRSGPRELTATLYPVDATTALAVADNDAADVFANPEVIVTPPA